MELESYRPIVERALADALKRGMTTTPQIATLILDRLQVAVDMSPQAVLINTSPVVDPNEFPGKRLEVPPTEDLIQAERRAGPVDVTRRFGAVPGKQDPEAPPPLDNYTKQEIYDYLVKNAPVKLSVEIGSAGNTRVLELQRSLENAPGDFNGVRLSYRIPGQGEATDPITGLISGAMYPIVQVLGSEKTLDAAKYLAEIVTQAKALYRVEQNTQVKPNFRPQASLSESLIGAPNLETDRESSSADMARWGRMDSTDFNGLSDSQARALIANKR